MPITGQYSSQRIPVPPEFETVFSHFYSAVNYSAETIHKTLVPSFQTILVFGFGEPASLTTAHDTITIDKCIVLGPVKQAFDYALPVGSEILVANFKDDAFYRFFGQVSLLEKGLHPDELSGENCFTQLWHSLANLSSPTEKTEQILDFCKPYLDQRSSLAELITTLYDDSINPVKVIAQQTGQTERNIQLRHKKLLGYSAKEINRYRRFLKALSLLDHLAAQNKNVDWFEIIDQCHYYDQSQLIHDFTHYLHLTPARYLSFQQDICRATAG